MTFRTLPKFFLQAALLLIAPLVSAQNNLSQWVNPFIGTGGHGHTFPGAVLPFGMVQLSPDTRIDGSWDGCSGYHYSDSVIYGFSHTHLSGTGCSDWGDVMLMPMIGTPTMNPKSYSSSFSHRNEKAAAGYYSVLLNKNKIKVELTVTPRVGIHRYTFPKGNKEGVIILDLLHRDKTLDCGYRIVDSVTLVGFRKSEAWAKEQTVYFAIRFSKPYLRQEFCSNRMFGVKTPASATRFEGAYFKFDTKDGEPIQVKVALSSVSFDGAVNNMNTETQHWDFDRYRVSADNLWNQQLQKIDISEPDANKKAVFYTALYHASIHPSLAMDVDGRYMGRDFKAHQANGYVNYSVYSLWDTYRALHPLFTLIEKKRTVDFIQSFLHQYKESGRLPMWELSANETDCMIGFHSVSAIADAFTKGIGGFDTLAVYEAMKAASNYSAYGIPIFNKQGYLQVDDESESVSKSLEYAYDNWCIAQMAKLLNKPEEEKLFLKRSLAYKHLFDASTGHMRPRKNGNWLSPFYANEINNHFTEGNSWQYSFYVPHDVEGLMQLHGGAEPFEKKLDELFTTDSKTRGRDQADVTGLIGQYAHGNEPSHHMAYLYNYVGKPHKTISRIKQICNDFYKNSPDGLIGNEDCGQMSAWYVFSTLGMYPVCPGSTQYVLSEPLCKDAVVRFDLNNSFRLTADPQNTSKLCGWKWNGAKQTQSFIDHSRLLSGGNLEFIYGSPEEAALYGSAINDRPRSKVDQVDIIPAPIIVSAGQVFKDTLRIGLNMINTGPLLCMYSINGKIGDAGNKVYTQSFLLDSNATLQAKTFAGNNRESVVTSARFYKLRYNYQITIVSKANAQYMAEGAQSLMDGIRGDADWRKGSWLGYQGQNFECVVDLKSEKEISELGLGCLQDSRSWIVFPTEVQFYGSNDNKTFTLLQTISNTQVKAQDNTVQTMMLSKLLAQKTKVKYLKVVARNFGKLPAWHLGAGGEAFIFVDELLIR
jgi:predicted alpha-1,2-mannosidase